MLLSAFLFLSGCLGWKPFQPPPPEFESWSKSGASVLEVKKSMLECGYPSPYEATRHGDPVNQEEFASMYMCMRSSGFIFSDGGYDFCSRSNELNACKLGAVAPGRDIEKRLSGPFCHAYPNDPACH
jgi:hypothetical protein